MINLVVVLIILPTCKTFNKLAHKTLGRVSSRLLACYLEKLKVIHQCLAVTLVFTSGKACTREHFPRLMTIFIQLSVVHSIAHFVNAINFVKHFDPKLADINWARDANDVRTTTRFARGRRTQLIKLSRHLATAERLSADVPDTDGIFRLDDDGVLSHHLDVLDASDARIFLQQLSGRSPSVPCRLRDDVLPPGEVSFERRDAHLSLTHSLARSSSFAATSSSIRAT